MTDSDALTHLIQEADQDWGLAWKDEELARIEDGITQMLQLANEHDFELLVVIFPIDVQVYAQVDTPPWPRSSTARFSRLCATPEYTRSRSAAAVTHPLGQRSLTRPGSSETSNAPDCCRGHTSSITQMRTRPAAV